MKHLTIAGALAALIFAPLPAMAQAGAGMTVVSGASCPSTATVTVGNNRPLIGLTTGSLCTAGGGGAGSAPSATVGSTYPTTVSPDSGKNPSTGNTVALSLGSDGGQIPTQAAPATTRTTLTASTATLIDTGHTTRIAIEIQTEVALTAPVFICFTQLTACSATSYDKLLPIGAAGELYTPPFSPTGTAYAFTTQSGVILTSASWFSQ